LPRIVYGGGLVVDGTDTSATADIRNVIGNVLIFEADARADAEAFHANDPYTQNDLFETVIIEQLWQRVPAPDIVSA